MIAGLWGQGREGPSWARKEGRLLSAASLHIRDPAILQLQLHPSLLMPPVNICPTTKALSKPKGSCACSARRVWMHITTPGMFHGSAGYAYGGGKC